MNATQEVREQYKQAVKQCIQFPQLAFYKGRMSGLATALGVLGVTIDECREMCETCEEEIRNEQEQEELDAIERPASQAQVEKDETLIRDAQQPLANIRAEVRKASEEDIYECEHCNAEFRESEILRRDFGGELNAQSAAVKCKDGGNQYRAGEEGGGKDAATPPPIRFISSYTHPAPSHANSFRYCNIYSAIFILLCSRHCTALLQLPFYFREGTCQAQPNLNLGCFKRRVKNHPENAFRFTFRVLKRADFSMVVKILFRIKSGQKGKMKYETSKEEKHDIAVFICVMIVWIAIRITGVF